MFTEAGPGRVESKRPVRNAAVTFGAHMGRHGAPHCGEEACTGLGEHDETLASLEQAFSLRAVDLAVVRVDPRFAPIAADPRFTALLASMNLEPVSRPRTTDRSA